MLMNFTKKRNPRSFYSLKQQGYTLVELSIVILIGTAVGAATIALLNFQLQWQQIVRSQRFMIEEVPVVNNVVNRLMLNSDSFVIHADIASADAELDGMTAGRTVVLKFRDQVGNAFGIISLDPSTVRAGGFDLNYYNLGSDLATIPTSPSWTISGGGQFTAAAGFSLNAGILSFTAAGPNGENVTFSASTS